MSVIFPFNFNPQDRDFGDDTTSGTPYVCPADRHARIAWALSVSAHGKVTAASDLGAAGAFVTSNSNTMVGHYWLEPGDELKVTTAGTNSNPSIAAGNFSHEVSFAIIVSVKEAGGSTFKEVAKCEALAGVSGNRGSGSGTGFIAVSASKNGKFTAEQFLI